jgi:hypothetical protein
MVVWNLTRRNVGACAVSVCVFEVFIKSNWKWNIIKELLDLVKYIQQSRAGSAQFGFSCVLGWGWFGQIGWNSPSNGLHDAPVNGHTLDGIFIQDEWFQTALSPPVDVSSCRYFSNRQDGPRNPSGSLVNNAQTSAPATFSSFDYLTFKLFLFQA